MGGADIPNEEPWSWVIFFVVLWTDIHELPDLVILDHEVRHIAPGRIDVDTFTQF